MVAIEYVRTKISFRNTNLLFGDTPISTADVGIKEQTLPKLGPVLVSVISGIRREKNN